MNLILINGPTGIGKSTIVQRVHQELPLLFLIDIDAQRRYISGYRERRKESGELVLKLSLGMVENYLQNGYGVVIDKVLTDAQITERFIELGKKHGATVFDFILNAEKEPLIARADERGYKEGVCLHLKRFLNSGTVFRITLKKTLGYYCRYEKLEYRGNI